MPQEQSSQPFYDFMYAKYLLKDLFDIVMQEGDYVERAYNVWREIGNIASRQHSFAFTIENNGEVQLPCNVELVEAVSAGTRYVDESSDSLLLFHADFANMNANSYLPDAILRNSHQVGLSNQASQSHAHGEFIPYELIGRPGSYVLYFDKKFIGEQGVCIYKGICVDDDGNPLLTRKEAEAIAYKLAFIDTQKKMFMGDKEAASRLQYIQLESGRKMAAAKIPEYLSQNEWDSILSSMTRHDRKVFWSSYKLIQ